MAVEKYRDLLNMAMRSFSDRLFAVQAQIESLRKEQATAEKDLKTALRVVRGQAARANVKGLEEEQWFLHAQKTGILSDGNKAIERLEERIKSATDAAETYKQKIKEIENIFDDEAAARWIEKSLNAPN